MIKAEGASTSTVMIADDKSYVIKTRKQIYVDSKLLDRELYWLNKMVSFDRVPNVISYKNGEDQVESITMSYCGELLTGGNKPKDAKEQVEYIADELESFGCCHNDIKKSQLLVKDGKIHLVDFGWATATGKEKCGAWPTHIRNATDDRARLLEVVK